MRPDAVSDERNWQAARPVTSRSLLADFLRAVTRTIGASHYVLVEPSVEHGTRSLRILSSNWIFDALEDLGVSGLARIVESGLAGGAGAAPRPIQPDGAAFLSPDERDALAMYGHLELYCQKLVARGHTVFALFSAGYAGRIDPKAVARAHMRCSYALDQFFQSTRDSQPPSLLSDRERECLVWVSEGKTTDEVALILGVSSNTVNSYIAHAIQKVGASNRAMAIATAIRSGMI